MKTIVFILLGALALGGCRPPVDPEVVAQVGQKQIRVADLQSEIRRRAERGAAVADRNQILDDLIQREALLARARAFGLERDPQVRRAMENVIISHLKQRELDPRLDGVQVSSGEVQAQYEANGERYRQPSQRRLAILQVTLPAKASTETRRRLRERLVGARARALQDFSAEPGFGALAVEHSDDLGSRYQGGDIGWVTDGCDRSRWDPRILAAGLVLTKPGEVSDLIDATNRLYVVKLIAVRDPKVTPVAAVEPEIRQGLQRLKRRQIEVAFTDEVLRSVPVTVYSNVLDHCSLDPLPDATRQDDSPPAALAVQ